MWQKTILKMLWFKNNYLSIDSELNILNIGSLTKNIDTDFYDIFNEKRWTYEKLIFDKKNMNEYIEVWEKIPNSTYDVIISHNYLKFNHTSEFIIENMKRALKNNGIFCFFILPGEKLDNNQDKENYANEILFLFKNQSFEIKHFSDNSIYSSQKNFEYCIIGSKKEEQSYSLKELTKIMHKQTKENEELKTKLTNQNQLNEEIKTKLTKQKQLYEELKTKLTKQKQLNEEIEELKTKLTNQNQLNEEIKTKLTNQNQLNKKIKTKLTSQ